MAKTGRPSSSKSMMGTPPRQSHHVQPMTCAILLILCLATLAGAMIGSNVGTGVAASAPLFSDGFENGLSAWTGQSGTVSVQSSIVHHGAQALYASGSSDSYVYKSLSSLSSVNVRVWVRTATLPSLNYYGHDVIQVYSGTTLLARVQIYKESSVGWRVLYWDGKVKYPGKVGSVSANTWYCVEVSVQVGSPGSVTLWIGGGQLATYKASNNGLLVNSVRIGAMVGYPSYNKATYSDCVVIDNKYIGTSCEPAPPQPLMASIAPTSANIQVGSSVTFTLTVSGGAPPYTYQWFLDSVLDPAQASISYLFTGSSAGNHSVLARVKDSANAVADSLATVSVSTSPPEPSSRTFGKTTIGGLVYYNGPNEKSASIYTLPEAGEVVTLSYYFANSGYNAKMAIYESTTSGLPGKLRLQTASETIASTGWHTWSVTKTLLQAADYWLAISVSGNSYGRYDTGTQGRWLEKASYTNEFVDPCQTMNYEEAGESMYATYVPSSTPTPLNAQITPSSANIEIGQSVTFVLTTNGGKPSYSYQWFLNSTLVPNATGTSYTLVAAYPGKSTIFANVYDSSGSSVRTNNATVTVVSSSPYLGSWTAKQAMTYPLADITAVTYNSTIYVFGGYGSSDTDRKNYCLEYTPSSNSWSTKANMTYARWGGASAVYNGIAYVFGGNDGASNNRVEAHNITANRWTTKNNLPTNLVHQWGGQHAVTVGSKIYIFQGIYTYEYNASSDSYTQKADSPVQRRWGTCAYVNVGGEDRIYIIGGYDDTGGDGTNTNYYFRPTNNEWSSAQATGPYAAHGTLRDNPVIDGKIYYGFGLRQSTKVFYRSLYRYDPSTNTWSSALAEATYQRDGVGCGVVNNKLYAIGGRDDSTCPQGLDYNEEFDPLASPPVSKYAGNPLTTIPQYGASGAVHPDVIYFPEGRDGYKYWMVYTPYPPQSKENPSIVRSNDGITWTDAGISNPVIPAGTSGQWNDLENPDPDFVFVQDYNKWFMVWDGGDKATDSRKIALAYSSDGKSWTQYNGASVDGNPNPIILSGNDVGGQPWERAGTVSKVSCPTLLYENGVFYLYYVEEASGNNRGKAGLATFTWDDATNSIRNFVRSNGGNPIMDVPQDDEFMSGVGHLNIAKNPRDNLYYMYVVRQLLGSSSFELALLTSTDRVTWVDKGKVLGRGSADAWDGQHIYRSNPTVDQTGQIFLFDDRIRLYYSGWTSDIPKIGIAYMTATLP